MNRWLVCLFIAIFSLHGCSKPNEDTAAREPTTPSSQTERPPQPPQPAPRVELPPDDQDTLAIGIAYFAHSVGTSSGMQNVTAPTVNAEFLEKVRVFAERHPDHQIGHSAKNVDSTLDGSENTVKEGGNLTIYLEGKLQKTFVITAGTVGVKNKTVFIAENTAMQVDGAHYVFSAGVWVRK